MFHDIALYKRDVGIDVSATAARLLTHANLCMSHASVVVVEVAVCIITDVCRRRSER